MRTKQTVSIAAAGRHARGGELGFTLIELMITVIIIAILAALAVPSFNGIALSSKLNSIANSFMASVQLARSEAIKINQPVTLCASSNGTTCSGGWSDGWIVLAKGVAIDAHAKLPNGFQMSEQNSLTSIAFQSTGVGATFSTLTVCRATPTVGDQKRTIEISATGRPNLTKVSGASTCP